MGTPEVSPLYHNIKVIASSNDCSVTLHASSALPPVYALKSGNALNGKEKECFLQRSQSYVKKVDDRI